MRSGFILPARRWVTIGVAGVVLAAAGTVSLAEAGHTSGTPAPFFKSGNNGFPKPNGGAALAVNEGHDGKGALLTSISGGTNQAGYGLVGVTGGSGTATTFSGLSDVETQFALTQGTCVGGAPRWVINLANGTQNAFLLVYFDNSHQPYGGCNAGAQEETNIINNTSTGWFVGNANTPETYSQVLTTYGSWRLVNVEVVVDAGWDQGTQLNPNIQQVLLQKLKVNSLTAFPLPH